MLVVSLISIVSNVTILYLYLLNKKIYLSLISLLDSLVLIIGLGDLSYLLLDSEISRTYYWTRDISYLLLDSEISRTYYWTRRSLVLIIELWDLSYLLLDSEISCTYYWTRRSLVLIIGLGDLSYFLVFNQYFHRKEDCIILVFTKCIKVKLQ